MKGEINWKLSPDADAVKIHRHIRRKHSRYSLANAEDDRGNWDPLPGDRLALRSI